VLVTWATTARRGFIVIFALLAPGSAVCITSQILFVLLHPPSYTARRFGTGRSIIEVVGPHVQMLFPATTCLKLRAHISFTRFKLTFSSLEGLMRRPFRPKRNKFSATVILNLFLCHASLKYCSCPLFQAPMALKKLIGRNISPSKNFPCCRASV